MLTPARRRWARSGARNSTSCSSARCRPCRSAGGRGKYCAEARTAVTDECRAYLDEQFAAVAEHGLKARAAAVFKSMHRGSLDAQHCVGITVKYIESLFSRKSRAAKDAALRAIIKGEDDEDEVEDEDEEMEGGGEEEDEDVEEDEDGWGTDGDCDGDEE